MLRNLLWPVAVSLALNFRYVMTAPSASRAVLEQLSSVPDGWEQVSPAPSSQVLNFAIGMVSADPASFQQTVLDLSTPHHTNYGKFLSLAQVQELAKPSQAGSEAVLSWLASQNLAADSIKNDGSWIRFPLTVKQAEQMLQTKYYIFRSTLTGETRVLALSYSVPSSLTNYIQMIQPTSDFSQIQGPNVQVTRLVGDVNSTSFASDATANCDSQATPSCLENLYGLPRSSIDGTGNGIAVPGFLNEFASFADLSKFLTDMRPDLKNPQPTFKVISIDGGKNDPNNPGYEANLDIQYTVGLADRIPVTFYTDGFGSMQGFIDLANTILGQTPLTTTVISISYGFNEYQVSPTMAKTLCNIFMQLGSRGVSVIIASGDGGVAGSRPSDTCTTFVPTFPASCPFVTAVGATAGIPETAADLSAGGFSNIFARPSYQSAAVSGYLASIGNEYKGKFNPNGRGFPDVSALGSNIVITYKGEPVLVDGTSASAPIFASAIALLNAERLAVKLPPLGFLNPLLYYFPLSVNDITSGSNPSCGTNGFPAKLGWDPVTGLGTPSYLKMQSIVLGL